MHSKLRLHNKVYILKTFCVSLVLIHMIETSYSVSFNFQTWCNTVLTEMNANWI